MFLARVHVSSELLFLLLFSLYRIFFIFSLLVYVLLFPDVILLNGKINGRKSYTCLIKQLNRSTCKSQVCSHVCRVRHNVSIHPILLIPALNPQFSLLKQQVDSSFSVTGMHSSKNGFLILCPLSCQTPSYLKTDLKKNFN